VITLLELDWAGVWIMVHAVCKQSICLLLMLQLFLSPSYAGNPDNSRKGWMPASQNSEHCQSKIKKGLTCIASYLQALYWSFYFSKPSCRTILLLYIFFIIQTNQENIFWGGVWIFIIKEMLRNRILLLNIKVLYAYSKK
jgi:hypothetical protein